MEAVWSYGRLGGRRGWQRWLAWPSVGQGSQAARREVDGSGGGLGLMAHKAADRQHGKDAGRSRAMCSLGSGRKDRAGRGR